MDALSFPLFECIFWDRQNLKRHFREPLDFWGIPCRDSLDAQRGGRGWSTFRSVGSVERYTALLNKRVRSFLLANVWKSCWEFWFISSISHYYLPPARWIIFFVMNNSTTSPPHSHHYLLLATIVQTPIIIQDILRSLTDLILIVDQLSSWSLLLHRRGAAQISQCRFFLQTLTMRASTRWIYHISIPFKGEKVVLCSNSSLVKPPTLLSVDLSLTITKSWWSLALQRSSRSPYASDGIQRVKFWKQLVACFLWLLNCRNYIFLLYHLFIYTQSVRADKGIMVRKTERGSDKQQKENECNAVEG